MVFSGFSPDFWDESIDQGPTAPMWYHLSGLSPFEGRRRASSPGLVQRSYSAWPSWLWVPWWLTEPVFEPPGLSGFRVFRSLRGFNLQSFHILYWFLFLALFAITCMCISISVKPLSKASFCLSLEHMRPPLGWWKGHESFLLVHCDCTARVPSHMSVQEFLVQSGCLSKDVDTLLPFVETIVCNLWHSAWRRPLFGDGVVYWLLESNEIQISALLKQETLQRWFLPFEDSGRIRVEVCKLLAGRL